jgi:hypothetical protein
MKKLRTIISLTLLATVGLLAALINPLMVLFTSISIITFLAIVRQMNLYKIAMMMNSYAKNVSKLRLEIRAKLQTGFRDYTGSIEKEESHYSKSRYLR